MDDGVDVVVEGRYPDVARTHETGTWTKTDRNIAVFASVVAMLCGALLLVVSFWTRSASWWIAGAMASLAAASVASAWLANLPTTEV